jgi:predicted outer membrane repeat protein
MPYYPPSQTFELVDDTSPQLGGNLDLNGWDIPDKQDQDGNLDALSAVSSSSNRLPYFNGFESMTYTTLSSFARTLIDDSDAEAARDTLDIEEGTYTPTFTNDANVSSFGTVNAANYLRVGDMVVVSGRVYVNPISASVNTQFRMSIPIYSNFSLFADVGGTLFSKNSASLGGAILADTTWNRARFQYINTSDIYGREFAFSYMYRIK